MGFNQAFKGLKISFFFTWIKYQATKTEERVAVCSLHVDVLYLDNGSAKR